MKKLSSTMLLLIVLSLAAIALTACGSQGTKLNVNIQNFAYVPNTWTVPAGAQVTVTVHNGDSTEHEWAIMKKGTSVTAPFGDKDEGNIYWELDEIGPGESKTGTFTAPSEPGTYEIVCGLPGHIEKGMTGSLTVK